MTVDSSLDAAIDLKAEQPAFARLARVAGALFGAPFADVVLLRHGFVWRNSSGAERADDPAPLVLMAMRSRQVLWIENAAENSGLKDHILVTGPAQLRFYAGAPIITADGDAIGGLTVIDTKPRPYDAHLAERLMDLAKVVGSACDQARERQELAKARAVAEAANRAKSDFLANISHEIRTPMNGVLGVLHLIKAGPPAPERRRLIDEALASGVGLSDLLNDIIDYSDFEIGQIELAPEAIDPVEHLGSVVALLRTRAVKKGLVLRATSAPDMGFVSVDPARLRKVCFHLIGNAVKFTESGSIDVRLSTRGEGDGLRLRLEVEDTGIGISPEAQAGLFERFKQADSSSTRRFGGLGLGLAVTRRLVDIMGGEVGFASQAGKGSTFWAEIAAPACEPDQDEAEPAAGWLAGLRVLVVEDNATNRLVATKILGMLGADVETAEDGAEGVAAVERSQFDLIFMDIQMPVMDGVEATRRIRAMGAPKCQTPIVATTANVMPEQLVTYHDCGINGVVAKPISPAALLAEVSRIAQSEPEEALAAEVA